MHRRMKMGMSAEEAVQLEQKRVQQTLTNEKLKSFVIGKNLMPLKIGQRNGMKIIIPLQTTLKGYPMFQYKRHGVMRTRLYLLKW